MNYLFTRCLMLCFLCSVFAESAFANNAAYLQRQANYRASALTNLDNDAITIQAYESVPVDSALLYDLLSGIPTGEVADFGIVKLVRVLFLSTGQYDTVILPVLNSVPFWLTKNETTRGYWSENHMIMWMSSDWLLHEKYNRAIDSSLHKRLVHYLKLKNTYGFYEFFSSVYGPYALSGLLNLADFAQDAEIKQLATQAAQRLLKNMLLVTTSKGVYFPAAGRNYFSKYQQPYNQNHSHLIYILTGMGVVPGDASHAGGFLSTSTLPVDNVIDSWQPDVDTLYSIGHPIDSFPVIHDSLNSVDRTIFQWSSGSYFHPAVVLQTAQLLVDSNLWGHVDFSLLAPFSGMPVQSFPQLSESLNYMSMSSVICNEDVAIFKHNEISLSSIQNFWPGKVGYQQQPCVATIGTTAVLTAAGQNHNWNNGGGNNLNDNLPYVEQKRNLALLMYRPENRLSVLGYSIADVELHWQTGLFDEVATDSNWLIGRQQNNYVAVRRSCEGDDTTFACNVNRGQTWVILVGDSSMYATFQNFKNIVHQAQLQEDWFIDTAQSQSVYHAKITVDTSTIEHYWTVDTTLTTGLSEIKNGSVKIYPNPVQNEVTVSLEEKMSGPFVFQLIDLSGRVVLQTALIEQTNRIDFGEVNAGMYLYKIQGADIGLISGKLAVK